MSAKPTDKDLTKATLTAAQIGDLNSSFNSQLLAARLAEAEANKKALENAAANPKPKKVVQFGANTIAGENTNENTKTQADVQRASQVQISDKQSNDALEARCQLICDIAAKRFPFRPKGNAGTYWDDPMFAFRPIVQAYLKDPVNYKFQNDSEHAILKRVIQEVQKIEAGESPTAIDSIYQDLHKYMSTIYPVTATAQQRIWLHQICEKALPYYLLTVTTKKGQNNEVLSEGFKELVKTYLKDPENFQILGGDYYSVLSRCITDLKLPAPKPFQRKSLGNAAQSSEPQSAASAAYTATTSTSAAAASNPLTKTIGRKW